MWKTIGSIILRNRLFILLIISILTVFFGYFAATGLKIDNKYGNMLPKESEAQRHYLEFKEMFGEDGGSLVMAIQTDSLYTERNFLKWKELGDSILKFDGVESVISEATLFTINNNSKERKFEVSRIFSDVKFQEKTIQKIEKEIKNNPIYRNILYTDSSHVSLMIVGIDENFLLNNKKAKVVLDIEETARSYESYFGKVHFAGLPHLRVVIGKRVINEMYIFIAAAIFATSLLLYIIFRSFRVVLICNTLVFVAVIWSMGSIALFGFNISIMMALIPPLMIVIGTPNCIFWMTKYHQEYIKSGHRIKAITRVINKIGTATFLTNFTTALGFSTFIYTNSEKLTEFGIIASLNIMVIFLLSICILPIIISFNKAPKDRHLKHLETKLAVNLTEKITRITTHHRKAAYVVTACIIVISIVGIFKIKATGNITSDLPKEDQIIKDVQFLEKNFGGAIPFELMIDYKEKGRLFKKQTIQKVEELQTVFHEDSVFAKSISYVDFLKFINMAYHGNNPSYYHANISRNDKQNLKRYIDNFQMTNTNGTFTLNELVDTAKTILRVRTQIHDLGSYEIAEKGNYILKRVDSILNPEKPDIERLYKKIAKNKNEYIDSLLEAYPNVYTSLTAQISGKDHDLQYKFDSDYSLIKSYYSNTNFKQHLRKAIDNEYYVARITGTSVVASEGTQYLVNNLISSLIFAILSISVLMAFLFRSIRMVIISMVPNLIPLIITAGIMGWLNIPLKPSTLLVFSIALGISVDDTIHYLAKFRQELKLKKYSFRQCIIIAINESGLGMFYTSIVLFCGFSTFIFSQFGGTQSLGLLVSVTLLVAMLTNLIILPSLLLSLDRKLASKTFEEPYFEIYDEETDVDYENLIVSLNEKGIQTEDENSEEE
jgi:uncharacterized protein